MGRRHASQFGHRVVLETVNTFGTVYVGPTAVEQMNEAALAWR